MQTISNWKGCILILVLLHHCAAVKISHISTAPNRIGINNRIANKLVALFHVQIELECRSVGFFGGSKPKQ